MDFLPKDIEEYSQAHTTPETTLLATLNRETHLKVIMPRMLSGNLQGRFLSMVSKMMRPLRILEVGTYTAYSTLCLAEGLEKGGKVFSVDINEELEPIQRKYIDQAKATDKIVLHHGDAMPWILSLKEEWDLVFIDADKENYQAYFDAILPQVRKGGWIMADNVLWTGKVTQPIMKGDKETQALVDFNLSVHNDKRVNNLLLPFRDGVMMLEKL